jgi:hypothetical protein
MARENDAALQSGEGIYQAVLAAELVRPGDRESVGRSLDEGECGLGDLTPAAIDRQRVAAVLHLHNMSMAVSCIRDGESPRR